MEYKDLCLKIKNEKGNNQNNIIKIIYLLNKYTNLEFKQLKKFIPQPNLNLILKYCVNKNFINKNDILYSINDSFKYNFNLLGKKNLLLNYILTNSLTTKIRNLYKIFLFICIYDDEKIYLEKIAKELNISIDKCLFSLLCFEGVNVYPIILNKDNIIKINYEFLENIID